MPDLLDRIASGMSRAPTVKPRPVKGDALDRIAAEQTVKQPAKQPVKQPVKQMAVATLPPPEDKLWRQVEQAMTMPDKPRTLE